MKKPTCAKCGANTYLDVPKEIFYGEPFMGCYTCGWRLYGEADIRAYVLEFNTKADMEAARVAAEKKEQEAEARRRAKEAERMRREEEKARQALEEKRAKSQKVKLVEPKHVGTDPVLLLPIAVCTEPGDLPKCAWPPCEKRSRETSKYCSRKCTVKVAHRRDRLRRKKLKQAS